ncbi:MAG: tight adherence protein [Cryptosporangiaceae bacterium]|jgi:tight adherence protein B|nr:tight adherence protein [Cryptosporangiaceae bacterium]
MGVFLGLLLGTGLFLIVTSGRPRQESRVRWSPRRATRARLDTAGLVDLAPVQFWLLSIGAGVAGGVVVFVVSATLALGVAFGVFAALGPRALVTQRIARLREERRELWPHVVDDLASAVRAGLSLPEALAALAERGPESLRPAFARFASDYRATGSFGRCLDRLADELADPVADRLVEALRLTREVGGTDLGRLLRTLSQFLRDDARTRAELEARQSWTVNGARLALGAPWAVLLLLALRGSAVQVYDSPVGVAVLAGGGALSLVAYIVMKQVGRLPTEPRVLRGPTGTNEREQVAA